MAARVFPHVFPTNIDNSARSDFMRCHRYFFWKNIRRAVVDRSNIHLHTGKTIAKGLEMARRAYYDQRKTQRESIIIGARAAIAEWGDREWSVADQKSLGRACEALFIYLTRAFPLDEDPVMPWKRANGTSAVEYSFRIQIPNVSHPVTEEPLYWVGRYDMLGAFEGMPWVVDDKSTGRLGEKWAEQWDLRSQFFGYNWAAHENGVETVGTIVRGIGIMPKNTSIVEDKSLLKPWQMDRWVDQMIDDVRSMVQCWKDNYWRYDFDKACGDFGGCDYKTLCDSDNPEIWLPTNYTENDWNPMESDQ